MCSVQLSDFIPLYKYLVLCSFSQIQKKKKKKNACGVCSGPCVPPTSPLPSFCERGLWACGELAAEVSGQLRAWWAAWGSRGSLLLLQAWQGDRALCSRLAATVGWLGAGFDSRCTDNYSLTCSLHLNGLKVGPASLEVMWCFVSSPLRSTKLEATSDHLLDWLVT